MADKHEASENRLLQALPRDVSEKLLAHLEALDMEVRHSVFEPDQPYEYVYLQGELRRSEPSRSVRRRIRPKAPSLTTSTPDHRA
jgi:hypothetical protein